MGRLGDTIDYLTTVGVVTEPLLAGYAAYSPFDDGLRVFFVLLDLTLLLFGQSWDSTSFACFAHFSFAYIFRVDLYSRILPFSFCSQNETPDTLFIMESDDDNSDPWSDSEKDLDPWGEPRPCTTTRKEYSRVVEIREKESLVLSAG